MFDRKAMARIVENGHFLMGAVFTWFCYLLTHPIDPMYLLSGIVMMPMWLYWSHRALHIIPLDSWILLPVFHIWGHHHKPKPIQNRTLELFAETLWEILFWIVFPIWIQRVTGFHFIPTSVVLMGSFMWISIHIVNYSIIGNETHSRHHGNTTINYGPDILDHLFDTNYDDSHEDTTYYVFNAMVSALAVLVLKHYVQYSE